ncbi:phenolic acid decarboxylase [Tenacibaculum sp.]|nr:phenolic acid decarboxylase [Tenacibaculum sp.]
MENQKTNSLVGKTIIWEWIEGAFKGGKYEVSLFNNGSIHWKGLEGAEKGQEATDKQYSIMQISNNVHTLSWLESIGWTVTVTINTKENTAFGFVSNNEQWYPLSGILESIPSFPFSPPSKPFQ